MLKFRGFVHLALNIDNMLLIDGGKKGSAITKPLPYKMKKTIIKIDTKKVLDLSDNIDIEI